MTRNNVRDNDAEGSNIDYSDVGWDYMIVMTRNNVRDNDAEGSNIDDGDVGVVDRDHGPLVWWS